MDISGDNSDEWLQRLAAEMSTVGGHNVTLLLLDIHQNNNNNNKESKY